MVKRERESERVREREEREESYLDVKIVKLPLSEKAHLRVKDSKMTLRSLSPLPKIDRWGNRFSLLFL